MKTHPERGRLRKLRTPFLFYAHFDQIFVRHRTYVLGTSAVDTGVRIPKNQRAACVCAIVFASLRPFDSTFWPARSSGSEGHSNHSEAFPTNSGAPRDVVASSLEKQMIPRSLRPDRPASYIRGGEELLIDFRRRLELDAEERVERRRLDIAEQTLEPNIPGVRIRAWEKVHALRMPSSAEHPVLNVIAFDTELSLADVHEEQRVRSQRAATVI